MKKFREILEDSKSFADDIKIDLGNGVTKSLGELRAEDKESQGAVTAQLTAKERQLAEEKKQLELASANVTQMFQQYLEATGMSAEEALSGKKAVTRKQVAENADLDPNDPIVGKLVTAINSIKDEVGTIKGALSTQQEKVLKPILSTYLDDFYNDRWHDKIEPSLPKSAKGKISFEDAMKYAEKEGYKDQRGRLDLNKAARDLTLEYRIDEEAEKRANDRVKKLRDEDTLAAQTRPGHGGPSPRAGAPSQFKTEKGKTKTIEQALEMARQDVDIWTQGMGQS